MHELKRVVSTVIINKTASTKCDMHNCLVNKYMCVQSIALHMSYRNYFIGHSSSSVPRGMCHLTLHESDNVIDEIATAYVDMNLTTAKQFQQLAMPHLMRNNSQRDISTNKTANKKMEREHNDSITCNNVQYEHMILDSMCKDNSDTFSSNNGV